MPLTPLIATHLGVALAATALGPFVLRTRLGARPRPRLHQVLGRAWVALILATALTAAFIRDTRLPNVAGFTAAHVLVPLTLLALWRAFDRLARGNVAGHRQLMRVLYAGACLGAAGFALRPQRALGQWLWGALGVL